MSSPSMDGCQWRSINATTHVEISVEMDVGGYLASIDWGAAVLVAAALVVSAMVVLRFLLATTDEVRIVLPGMTDAAGKAVLDARTGMPIDSWVCMTCRSVNTPTATICYRGCGPRDTLGVALPDGRPRDPEVGEDART